MKLQGITPESGVVQSLVNKGHETGASFIVFVMTTPVLDSDDNFIVIAIYDKDGNRDVRLSPYKINNGKIEFLNKSEKRFDVFLD